MSIPTMHPYFPSPTTSSGGVTHFLLWPQAYVPCPNWQAICDAWIEYGFWESAAMSLGAGLHTRIWMTKQMARRFTQTFGKRQAKGRAQRIAICGLMMAMCQDDATAAMRGEAPHA